MRDRRRALVDAGEARTAALGGPPFSGRRSPVYVVYDGGEPVACGSAAECAARLGVRAATVEWYASASAAARGCRRRAVRVQNAV